MDIHKLINTNKIDRYTIEIEYTDDENKEHLKKIIEKLNKPLQNKLNNFNNKMDEYEKLTMKKQFYRLKLEQKKKSY
jgi:translation elongation factor EF-G